jgi:hypothetical protein
LYLWHAEIVATFGQKRAAFFTLFYQSKTVSSQFLFQPICLQGGIWSFEAIGNRSRATEEKAGGARVSDRHEISVSSYGAIRTILEAVLQGGIDVNSF